jgi:predicted glycosyltransferase
MGTSAPISHVGKLLFIPAINANEDDAEVVPLYAKLAYPWAKYILTPSVCNVGKWSHKKIGYESYHELAYLHPDNFKPDTEIASKYVNTGKPYFILRFVKLGAHHDAGITGISNEIAVRLIEILKPHGQVYISSERMLDENLEPYRIQINPSDMHHVMAFAGLFVGDSQTMAAEAGVLGTPFVRFNDFVGRIGYLRELEDKYHLGKGIKTNQVDFLLQTVKEMVNTPDIKKIYQVKKENMLKEKIDLTAFMFWFITNYPASAQQFKQDPGIQFRIQGT